MLVKDGWRNGAVVSGLSTDALRKEKLKLKALEKHKEEMKSQNTTVAPSSTDMYLETLKKLIEKNSVYKPSQAVTDAAAALDAHKKTKLADWTGGTYGELLKSTMDKIANREDFSYDLNADALYQQYKDQYINAGRLAMQDSMGQAAAMTGGYGNSYAATIGNQAYQNSMQQLNGIIPDLYQIAHEQYELEGDKLQNKLSMYGSLYGTEYGEYRDKVADWNTEAQRLANEYSGIAESEYSNWNDNYEYLLNLYNSTLGNNGSQYNNLINNLATYAKDYDLASINAALGSALSSGEISEEEYMQLYNSYYEQLYPEEVEEETKFELDPKAQKVLDFLLEHKDTILKTNVGKNQKIIDLFTKLEDINARSNGEQ